MNGLIIGIHLVVCFLLIIIILIQAGRGTGLVEGFSGVESMFGTKTNALLTRTTAILSTLFFLTCLSLALLSAKQSRSLMRDLKAPARAPIQAQAQKETTPPEAAAAAQKETVPVQAAEQKETAPAEPLKQPQQPQGQAALPKAEK